MMSVLVIVLTALWFVPFLFMAKPDKEVKKKVFGACAAGATIAVIAGVLLETVLGNLIAVCMPQIPEYVYTSTLAGVIEETLKLAIALLFAKKLKNARPIDYILVFGAAGFGFEAVESALFTSTLDTALLRGISALHIVWLYFDGIAYVQAKENGKNGVLLRNFLICTALHIGFDMGLGCWIANEEPMFYAAAVILNIVMAGYSMYIVYKKAHSETAVPNGMAMAY